MQDTEDLLETALTDMKESGNGNPNSHDAAGPRYMYSVTSHPGQVFQLCYYLGLTHWIKSEAGGIIPNEEIPGTPEVLHVAQKGWRNIRKWPESCGRAFESLEIAHDQMANSLQATR